MFLRYRDISISLFIEILLQFSIYLQSVPGCVEAMQGNQDPYIALIGTLSRVESSSLMCKGRVLVQSIGSRIFSMLIVLIAFCHTFAIQYNHEVREGIEFVQEKLLGIVEGKKKSTAYVNLLRAISCIQCKADHVRQSQNTLDETFLEDSDQTQLACEWES